MLPNRIKPTLAFVLDSIGVCRLGLWFQHRFYGPHIRAVNYHDIAPHNIAGLEDQLRFFSGKFAGVSRDDLRHLLDGRVWGADRPGLIITFDDGHRSHYEVAAPMLEKYGFTGWFFVPSQSNELTAAELQDLAGRHVLGSHTRTHCRMNAQLPRETMGEEIEGSGTELEKVIGREVDTFAWVGGEEDSYSRAAAKVISKSYKYSFMTNSDVITSKTSPLQLQRTNIEADYPLWLVRFQLSGLMDVYYYFKRRRVNRLTA